MKHETDAEYLSSHDLIGLIGMLIVVFVAIFGPINASDEPASSVTETTSR